MTIPILPSPDFDATASFYSRLAFAERGRWEHEYLILVHTSSLELHFWFHRDLDPAANDAACFVRFDTAAECLAMHDAWARATKLPSADRRAIPRLHAPTEARGMVEWNVIDVHGNLIRLGARTG